MWYFALFFSLLSFPPTPVDGIVRVRRIVRIVYGTWGSWGGYGTCSHACGYGHQRRYRPCEGNIHGDCRGSSSDDRTCFVRHCPVNGNWGSWSNYGTCSKTCGNGAQGRTRLCNNPAPNHGGSSCAGSPSDERTCFIRECPDHRVFSVICHELHVTAIWEKYNFQAQALTVYVNNPDCNHYQQNRTHIWVTTNFTDCNSIIREQGNTIHQQNSAIVTASYHFHTIQRMIKYTYNMGCVFDRNVNVSTTDGFTSGIQDGGTTNGTGETTFEAAMEMYTSTTFRNAMSRPISFTSYQPMFVGINEINNNKQLKFVAHQCFATPTENMQGVNYMFFALKCPIDPSFNIISNTSDHFYFSIEAFTFLEIAKSIHIHCSLYVCRVNSTSPKCQQKCSRNIRERRAIPQSSMNERPLEEVDVVSDEIRFEKKPMCNEISCIANAHCLEMYPAVCRCNHGYVKNRLTGTCVNNDVMRVTQVHLDTIFNEEFAKTSSPEFTKLAKHFEDNFHQLLRLDEKDGWKILGVKVLGAAKGSVILDLAIIHDEKITAKETFDYLTNDLIVGRNNETKYNETIVEIIVGKLKIKRHIMPSLELEMEDEIEVEKGSNKLLIILVCLVLVVIGGIVGITMIVMRYKRNQRHAKENGKGIDNDGVEMEQKEVKCVSEINER